MSTEKYPVSLYSPDKRARRKSWSAKKKQSLSSNVTLIQKPKDIVEIVSSSGTPLTSSTPPPPLDPARMKEEVAAFERGQLSQHNKLLLEAVKQQGKLHKDEMDQLISHHEVEMSALEEKYKRLHEEFQTFVQTTMVPDLAQSTRRTLTRQKSENHKENNNRKEKERVEALQMEKRAKEQPMLSDKKMKRRSWSKPKPEVIINNVTGNNRPRPTSSSNVIATGSSVIAKKVSRAMMSKNSFLNKASPVNPERTLSRNCGYLSFIKSDQWSRQQLFCFLDKHYLFRLRGYYEDSDAELIPDDGDWPRFIELREERPNALILESATLDQLLLLLITPENSPLFAIWDYPFFLSEFLLVFETFITPEQLLLFLIKKYNEVQATFDGNDFRIRSTILRRILPEWVRLDRACDFKDDVEVYFKEFVQNHQKGYFDKEFEKLDLLRKIAVTPPGTIDAPDPMEPPQKKLLTVLDLNPLEVARQMTLMEASFFNRINRNEFLKGKMFGKEKEKLSPNLVMLVEHANHISSWIKTEILRFSTVKHRSDAIVLFISVLPYLEQLRNFNGLVHVLSALHNSTITRLKKSWELVPKKDKEILDQITELMSNSSHYKNYRELIHSLDISVPCIPLLSVVCSDLFLIDENLPDYETAYPNHISWRKMKLIAKLIFEVKRFSPVQYNLKEVAPIQNLITTGEYWVDDNITYEIATIREAEEQENPELEYTITEDLWEKYGLSERDWTVIMTGSRVTYDKGSVILEQGVTNSHLYRVKSGRVAVFREGEKVGTLTEGQPFGEISVILTDKVPSPEKYVAESETVELDQNQVENIHSMSQEKPEISGRLQVELGRTQARRLRMYVGRPKTVPQLQLGLLDAKVGSSPRVDVDVTDRKLCKRFGIMGEVVVQELPCVWKKTGKGQGSTGILYLFQNHIGFSATSFGLKQRETIAFSTIKDITLEGKKQIDIITNNGVFTCSNFQKKLTAAFDLLHSMWQTKSTLGIKDPPTVPGIVLPGSTVPTGATPPPTPAPLLHSKDPSQASIFDYLLASDENRKKTPPSKSPFKRFLKPTEEDWNIILKGARTVTYQENDIIAKEGERVTRVFQIQTGACKVVQKQAPDVVLATIIPEDNIFGEKVFLSGAKSTASIIATKTTTVTFIEAYFLNILIQHHPSLAGRFFHYLSSLMSRRVITKSFVY